MQSSSFSVLPYLRLFGWAVFAALPLACAMPLAAQTIITKTLDSGSNGNTGQYTSQAIVNGNPAVAYYNVTDGSLMYAHNSAVDGSGSWSVVTVDSAGVVGFYPSLGVVNGNPAISYYDSSNGDLKYVRALDASGTSWGAPVTIDSPGNVGSYTSLVVVNGNPAISYYDGTSVRLKYVRATDASGTSWGTPVTLDGTGNVGQYTSLAVVNGNPAISYLDLTNFDLKFVRAADPMGTSWGTPVTLDSAGNVGFHISQAVVNGNPAISYYDATNQDLKYVRALDASGTIWGLPVTLDSTGTVGQSTSLAVVNGNPAISYNDVTNGDLKYMRATNASGTSWGAPVTLDGPSNVGQYTSLAVVNGNPAISYYDVTNQDLKYVRATDASGTSWSAGVTADSGFQSGAVGQYTSQAVVNGNPAICYFDVTNGDLKYMRATDVGGTIWGLPVTIDSPGSVGQYTSMVVVNGNPAISYYDVTNQDLKYVRALDASGTSWGTPVTIDSTGSVAQYTSMVVVDGNPAISYFDNTNFDLKYVRATDASGTSWGAPVALDSAIVGGQYTSMAVVNGNPAISYYDNTNSALKYVRAMDASGTNWGTPVTLDSAGDVGWDTSLAVVNGNPAISYYDVTNQDLKYVRALDASGTSWGTPVTIDGSTDNVGQYTSMVVVNGNPAISYYDVTNLDLKYVRATDASGTSWGTPVTLDGIGSVGQYTSLAVVNGNPAISYYYATELNLKWATMILVSPPTVTSVSPSSGGVGTGITITGTGFTGATSVTIGGTAATSFNVVNDTTITAVTPAGNVGSASVLVTTPGGTNAANTAFTYLASNTAPTITSNGGGPTASLDVAENTTAVTTVVATDSDLPAQTISYSKSGPDAALFNLDSGTGALTFAAAPDFETNAGPFSITVTATDNGTPSNLSDSQDLTITVTNVNEMPSFTVGANQTHNFGTNTVQTISNWATNIDDGDSTVTQTLTFNVFGNSNPGIFTTPPSIDANGTLTYTPNGTAGMAIINVRLTDDNSINGTAALNSFLESFVITVNTPPDINITGNNQIIVTGDTTPSTSDGTDFGDGFPGIPVSKLFTIQNVGSGPLIFTGMPIISISGPHASEFTVSTQPAASLSSFATSFFYIDFLAADAGVRSATVTVASNDPDEASFTFAIQGNGLAANIVVEGNSTTITKGDTTPSPADHTDFGSVTAAGAVTEVRTFTIRNTGNRDLTGIFATTDGSLSDFTITTTPASTLAPAGTTTLGVTFNPTASGLRSVTMQIYSSDRNDSPFEFTMAGTGVNSAPTDITLTPASIAENNAANATVGALIATDADVGQTHTFSFVTGAGDTDNGSFTIDGTALKLTPVADFETKSSYSVRVQADDGNGGTFARALSVTITNVNEVPSFVKGANQVHTLDSGAKTVPGWATGIDDGDSTVVQGLSFTVLGNSNPAIFSTAPAIAPDGTLTYSLSGTLGTSTITVYLTDDTSIGGQAARSSGNQSFTITNQAAPDYVVTYVGGHLTCTDMSGNGDNFAMYESTIDPGSVRLNAGGRTFSVNGGLNSISETGPFPMADLNSVTLNAGAGNDIIRIQTGVSGSTLSLPDLTINGGTGDDSVQFQVSVTFKPNIRLDVNLQNDDATPGRDSISLSSNVLLSLSGTGAATLKTSQNVAFGSGSMLRAEDGDILIEANQQTTAMTGNFHGVDMNNARVEATGIGSVTMRARSGTSAGFLKGLNIYGGSKVLAQSGGITLEGHGQPGHANTGNYGVGISGSGGATQVNATDGDIHITGVGGAAGTAGLNQGVVVEADAEVSATGAGNVTLIGTGGNLTGTGNTNHGVVLFGTNTKVTTENGDLTLTGQAGGGAGSNFNFGVNFASGLTVGSTGSGSILITATGNANGAGGGFNTVIPLSTGGGDITISGTASDGTAGGIVGGVGVTLTGALSAAGGDIQITGVAKGVGLGLYGIRGNRSITTTGSGTITLHGTAAAGGSGSGIYMPNATGASVSTAGGSISLTGIGGGGTQGSNNTGVDIREVTVSGPGAGASLTVHGTGGSGVQQYNHGVEIFFANGRLLTSGGDIHVTGIAGTNGTNCTGVSLVTSSSISAGGNGNVTLHGTGGGTLNSHGLILAPNAISVAGSGDISLTGIGSGTGNGVFLNQGLSSAGGDITVQGTAGSGGGFGISGLGTVAAAGGDISITGITTGTGNNRNGLFFSQPITTSDTGTITLQGTASGDGQGVGLNTIANITTGGGSISMTGIGGGGGTSTHSIGIRISNSAIVSGPAAGASLTLHGTGGASTTDYPHGVETFSSSQLLTSGGDIVVTGIGGPNNTTESIGVQIFSGCTVSAGGTGSITLNGTGGAASANAQHGVNVSTSTLSTNDGPITLTGTAGGQNGTLGGRGINLLSNTSVTAGGNHDISFVADSVNLSSTSSVTAAGDDIIFLQRTAGTDIALGSNDTVTGSPLVLGLTDAELDRLSADEVRIGDADSGSIQITGSLTPVNYPALRIGKALAFASTGSFTSAITSETVFQKILVEGAITLDPAANVFGVVLGGFVPSATAVIPIIQNLSAGMTSGSFLNKPEGAPTALTGLARRMRITYAAGSGNHIAFYSSPVAMLFGNASYITNGDATPSLTDHTEFGDVVTIGSNTVVRTFTVFNDGLAPLTGIVASVGTGIPVGGFARTTTPDATLASGVFTTFDVSFDPMADGLQSSTVTVTSSQPLDSPYAFAIQGTGLPSAEITVHDGSHSLAPELVDGQLTPVSFGSTAPDVASLRNFTVRNIGTLDLNITGITAPVGYLTNGSAVTLAPGSSYGFQVSLSSSTPATYAGSITISSDDLDEAAFDFPITGTVVAPGSDPVVSVGENIAVQGGSGSAVLGGPPGSTLYSFVGSPALNSSGVLASAVQIRHADASLHTGMMVGQPMVLIATDTDTAPSLPGVTHFNFGPPVINETGYVAFIGEVRGAGITANSNSRCLFSNASDGSLKLVARAGTNVGLTSDLKTIGNFSIGGDLVIFLGTLVDNSIVLFGWDANTGLRPLMRNGQSLDANGVTKTVKNFSVLETSNASSGHGKEISVAPTGESLVTINVTFTDNSSGVVVGSFDGTSDTGFGATYGASQQLADTYASPAVIPLAKWSTFRSPGFDNTGNYYGFISQMVTNTLAGVTSTNNVGVFVDTAPGVLTLQLRENDTATGTGGLVFSDFSDLVLGGGDYEFLVKGEVRGSGVVVNVNDKGLWAQHATNGLVLVAREGSEAPGVAGSTFFRLTQMALPGTAQPMFQASMTAGAGGVTTANDTGLWVINEAGEVKLAVREGDVINVAGTDRTVSAITALLNGTTTGGALGRRVFLEDGQLTLLLTFSGGVQAHARVVVP